MSDSRTGGLAAIAEQIRSCRECSLYEGTNNAVPGSGSASAEIVFIGEGPGFHEDRRGLPFVGRSGDYLEYLLGLIDMHRDQVFITNVVKHRAPDNRDPRSDEIFACKAWLDEQLAIIQPAVIATLGRFSMARYFPNERISRIHGKPRFSGKPVTAYYPLFHPAAALRNPGLRRDMETDIRRLPDLVAEVRQRRAQQQDADETPTQLSLF